MKNKTQNKFKNSQKTQPASDCGWAECPECGAKIRRENIKRHMKRVHGKDLVQEETPEKSRNRTRTAWRMAAASVTIILITTAVIGYTFIYPQYTGNGIPNPQPPSPQPTQPPAPYTPTHGIGSGPSDFWTVYPSGHVSAGASVAFPSWVTNYVSSKVLLILDHSEGCYPCIQQGDDIKTIMSNSKYSGRVTYLDLLSGSGDPKASECFDVFDPDGKNHYIPLTIIVTKNPSGGYLWHSWEGVTGKSNLETWLNDAIYYYNA